MSNALIEKNKEIEQLKSKKNYRQISKLLIALPNELFNIFIETRLRTIS
jgi:hypothetical protein